MKMERRRCSWVPLQSSPLGRSIRRYCWNLSKLARRRFDMFTLTAGAVSEVKRLLTKENNPQLGLRVGVRAGGCSGFSYVLGFDTPQQEDQVQEVEGVKIVLDNKSAPYLEGTQLD